MNYTTLQTELAVMLGTTITDPNFVTIFPQLVVDAEQRCYRECNFLNATTSQNQITSIGTRQYTLPSFTISGVAGVKFLVLQSEAVITPASTLPDAGTRVPLTRVSREFLDFVWPTAGSGTGVPKYCAMLDDQTLRIAPAPDQTYYLELVGTYRPPTMTATNPNTYLGDTYPDLFLAACMVFGAGYQKNFGAQADDPRMAMSWESQYQIKKASALPEAFRQKGEGAAWTPYEQSPQAQPART